MGRGPAQGSGDRRLLCLTGTRSGGQRRCGCALKDSTHASSAAVSMAGRRQACPWPTSLHHVDGGRHERNDIAFMVAEIRFPVSWLLHRPGGSCHGEFRCGQARRSTRWLAMRQHWRRFAAMERGAGIARCPPRAEAIGQRPFPLVRQVRHVVGGRMDRGEVQVALRQGRPGGRHRLALEGRRQLLRRSCERAGEQRLALLHEGREPAHHQVPGRAGRHRTSGMCYGWSSRERRFACR